MVRVGIPEVGVSPGLMPSVTSWGTTLLVLYALLAIANAMFGETHSEDSLLWCLPILAPSYGIAVVSGVTAGMLLCNYVPTLGCHLHLWSKKSILEKIGFHLIVFLLMYGFMATMCLIVTTTQRVCLLPTNPTVHLMHSKIYVYHTLTRVFGPWLLGEILSYAITKFLSVMSASVTDGIEFHDVNPLEILAFSTSTAFIVVDFAAKLTCYSSLDLPNIVLCLVSQMCVEFLVNLWACYSARLADEAQALTETISEELRVWLPDNAQLAGTSADGCSTQLAEESSMDTFAKRKTLSRLFVQEVKRSHEYGAHLAAVTSLYLSGRLNMSLATIGLSVGLFLEVFTDVALVCFIKAIGKHASTTSLIPIDKTSPLLVQRALGPAGCLALGVLVLATSVC